MESLDYDSRQIKKSTILNLATMGFIGNATNLVITGSTGVGKTYLAYALGIEACKQTYRVMYTYIVDAFLLAHQYSGCISRGDVQHTFIAGLLQQSGHSGISRLDTQGNAHHKGSSFLRGKELILAVGITAYFFGRILL